MRRIRTFLGFGVLLLLAACAGGMPAPVKTGTTSAGPALVDAKGMTLYTFDRDTGGKSACTGQCAVNWPPLAAPADARTGDSWAMTHKDPLMPPTFEPSMSGSGPWTIVVREDGAKQWAYRGKPLYTFARDQKPGDAAGQGALNGAWQVARP